MFQMYVQFFTYFYLALPVITLTWWVIILLARGGTIVAPVSILIMGLAVPLFVYGFMKIYWNHYRLKLKSGICIFTALVLAKIYQVLVIFNEETVLKFFLLLLLLFFRLVWRRTTRQHAVSFTFKFYEHKSNWEKSMIYSFFFK